MKKKNQAKPSQASKVSDCMNADWLVNHRQKPNQLLLCFLPLLSTIFSFSIWTAFRYVRQLWDPETTSTQCSKSILYSRCKNIFNQPRLDTFVGLSPQLWHVPRGVLLTARKNKLQWLHRLALLLFCAGGETKWGCSVRWLTWVGPVGTHFRWLHTATSLFLVFSSPLWTVNINYIDLTWSHLHHFNYF